MPPLEPAQDHDQGPEPEMDEAEPVVQRLVVGAEETVVPFADPQAPFTAVRPPPAGYALFEPGRTGTPPGTSTRTILTLLKT